MRFYYSCPDGTYGFEAHAYWQSTLGGILNVLEHFCTGRLLCNPDNANNLFRLAASSLNSIKPEVDLKEVLNDKPTSQIWGRWNFEQCDGVHFMHKVGMRCQSYRSECCAGCTVYRCILVWTITNRIGRAFNS